MDNVINNVLSVLQTWWQETQDNLPKVLAGLLVLLIFILLARVLSRAVSRVLHRRKKDQEIAILLTRIVRWSVIGLGIILALEQAGQDVSALLAGVGILGFTVGFALQDISANLVSGIILLLEQPFDIGDSIETAGYGGTVKNIQLRATELLTWDGLLVLIPNKEVFTSTITNFSRTSQRRIGLSVGVGYESDLERVEKTALEALNDVPGVKADPAPFMIVDSFGDSAINVTIYLWYDTKDEGLSDMTNIGALTIKKAFDQAGISIPYPIRSVFVEK
jgi:small conductance mechanosensitive channel